MVSGSLSATNNYDKVLDMLNYGSKITDNDISLFENFVKDEENSKNSDNELIFSACIAIGKYKLKQKMGFDDAAKYFQKAVNFYNLICKKERNSALINAFPTVLHHDGTTAKRIIDNDNETSIKKYLEDTYSPNK